MRNDWNLGLCAVLLAAVAGAARADITWNISYLDTTGGWFDPSVGATRRATAQAVFDYLDTVLDASGTVDFQFKQGDFNATGPLATSGPRYSGGGPNGYQSGHLFTHATTGTDPDSSNPDATATFDFGYNWNNGTGTPGSGKVDLFSVLLHEVTHSLGVLSQVSGAGISNISGSDPGIYTTFNSFLRSGNVNGGTALFGPGGDFLGVPANLNGGSPGVYFYGPNAMALNSGNPVRVFTQPQFNSSSISHYTGTGVMAPSTSPATEKRKYSALDLAVLKDLGWNIKPQGPGALAIKNFTIFKDTGNAGVNDWDINAGNTASRFGFIIDDTDEAFGPPKFYTEDAATADPSGPTGALTQANHASAPGMIALLNDNGAATANGTTWISPVENFRVPIRTDERLVLAFDVNPNADSETEDGTYFDFIFGTSDQGAAGGAPATDGIALRLNVTGSLAGQYQLFDGTGGAGTLLEDLDSFLSLDKPSADDIFSIRFEIIGPRFDEVTPTEIAFFLDGVLMHSFMTDGGLGDNYLTFAGGPGSSGSAGEYAIYGVGNIEVFTEELPEPATLLVMLPAVLAMRPRPRRR